MDDADGRLGSDQGDLPLRQGHLARGQLVVERREKRDLRQPRQQLLRERGPARVQSDREVEDPEGTLPQRHRHRIQPQGVSAG